MTNCETCSKPFEVGGKFFKRGNRTRRFCSASCRTAPRREKNAQERRARYAALKAAGATAAQASYGSDSNKRAAEVMAMATSGSKELPRG